MITDAYNRFKRLPESKYSKILGAPFKYMQYGLDPITFATGAADVARGKTSVGGAIGGQIGGTIASYGASKGISKLTNALGNSSVGKALTNRLPGKLKFLPKLLGSAANMAGSLATYSAVSPKMERLGDKYMPIWRNKKRDAKLRDLTDDQLSLLHSTMRSSARAGLSGEPAALLGPVGTFVSESFD